MKSSRSVLIVGLCAFFVTLALASTHAAQARHRRLHASACQITSSIARYSFTQGILSANSEDINVICAIPSDSELPHVDVLELNVHGHEPDGLSNNSRACITNYSSSVHYCGDPKNWGSSGVNAVDVSEWQSHSSWFPYVWSELDYQSSLRGVYVED